MYAAWDNKQIRSDLIRKVTQKSFVEHAGGAAVFALIGQDQEGNRGIPVQIRFIDR